MNYPMCDMQRVLIDTEELDAIISRLADQINRDYAPVPSRTTLILCVLKGSLFFTAALMQRLTVPAELDFVKVSSYGKGTESSGELIDHLFPQRNDWQSLDVLVVEDIIDSGNTLSRLTERIRALGAASVRVVTLLDKPSRRQVDFRADYTGREIPNAFVVGFGLDLAEQYRGLPFIGIPREDVIRAATEQASPQK